MIKINLLPQEMAGGRASSSGPSGGGSAIVALVLMLAFGVNILIAGFLYHRYQTAETELKSAKAAEKAALDELKNTEVSYNERRLSLERMEKLIQVADKLDPVDRLLWSRKLNAVPLLIPQGVFLTELNVTQRITETETPESIQRRNDYAKAKKGTPPEVEKVPNISQILTMNGISYVDQGSDTQRLDQINTFYRNLLGKKVKLPFDKEETSFMEGFVPLIEPSPYSASKIEGRDVFNFKFTITTRSITIN